MKKCKCGFELQDGWKVCPACGESVSVGVIDDEFEKLSLEEKAALAKDSLVQKRKANDEARARRISEEKALAKAAELQKQIDDIKNKDLPENEKVKARLAELEPLAERAKKQELKIKEYLDAELEAIPQERLSLIPEGLAPEDKLSFIKKNEKFLKDETLAPKKVNGETPAKKNDTPKLTIPLKDAVELTKLRPAMAGKSAAEIEKEAIRVYAVSQ